MNDCLIAMPFCPFAYQTARDRRRTLAYLWYVRRNNQRCPPVLGALLSTATNEELEHLADEVMATARPARSRKEDLVEAARALEILGYFHGLHCRDRIGTPCLGQRIAGWLAGLTSRLACFTP